MTGQLIGRIEKINTPICVGLDPMLSYAPGHVVKKPSDAYGEILGGITGAIRQFSKEIIDHTYDLIPATKLQITTHEQFGIEGLIAYKRAMEYCHEKDLTVVRDVKRRDIGSTSTAYTTGHLGMVQVGSNVYRGFDVDMPTVNPYLGTNGVRPFVGVYNTDDKELFVPVKTSNPGSGEFQDHLIDGRPLYGQVAREVMGWGAASMDGAYGNMGAVVGAICLEVSRTFRRLMPVTYFLVPRYDAQGGTADDLRHCFNEDELGTIVNSSRSIIAAYKQDKYKQSGPEHFSEASRQAVLDMVADINSVL